MQYMPGQRIFEDAQEDSLSKTIMGVPISFNPQLGDYPLSLYYKDTTISLGELYEKFREIADTTEKYKEAFKIVSVNKDNAIPDWMEKAYQNWQKLFHPSQLTERAEELQRSKIFFNMGREMLKTKFNQHECKAEREKCIEVCDGVIKMIDSALKNLKPYIRG
jgi:hypothetical protein